MKSREWMADAACNGHDPEMWHATPKDGALEVAQALAICRACPVQASCLEDVMEAEADQGKSRYGVAGGLTAHHRALLANGTTKALPPCGTEARYRRHKLAKEPDCPECREAAARAGQARRQGKPRQGRIAAGVASGRIS